MKDFIKASAKEPSDAYLITEAQSKLKEIVAEHVKNGRPMHELKVRCEHVVRKLKENVKNEETRATLDDECMERYIRELYDRFTALFGALHVMAQIMKQQKVVTSLQKDGLPRGGIPLSDDPLSYNMEPGARDYFYAYHKEVKRELEKILSLEPRPSYERNVNLRTIAELNVRYQTQTKMISDLSDRGEDLVWILPHANCSRRCEPWQGKLYSLSGRTGKTEDGVPFQPLSNATEIYVETKSGKRYRNGCVTGFGCRHKLDPHRPGKRPAMVPASVIEKQRRAEELQRSFERRIRYQKEKAAVLSIFDPDGAKKARAKARQLSSAYEDFSKANGMPTVPTRTRTVPGERIYERNNLRIEQK